MAWRALLHELREHAGAVCRVPWRGQRLEDPIAQRSPPPVRNDDLLVVTEDVGGNGVRGERPAVEDPQVLEAVARQLGKGRHHFRRGSALADDQLAIADIDRLMLAEMAECKRAHHGNGVPAFVRLIEGGHQDGALGRDRRLRFQTAAAERLGARGHASPPMYVSRPWRRNSAAITPIRSGEGGSRPRRG